MTLGDKQALYTRTWVEFTQWALWYCEFHGLRMVLEEGARDRRWKPPGGHQRSTHYDRLAQHVLLFRRTLDGWDFLTKSEAYRPLGEEWERRHELARWGGRFDDGNHFSFEHNGVK